MPTSDLSLRQRVEQVSRPLLVRLTALPRLAVPLITVVLLAVGMFAPLPFAWIALIIVLAFIAWIAYLAWPAVTTGGKVLRLLMLALIIGLAATRL